MGAVSFMEVVCDENHFFAFNQARGRARARCGGGGYSGTIAEKSDYDLYALPARVTPEQAIYWLELAGYARHCLEEYKDKAERKFLANCPEKHRGWVTRLESTYSSKWGPAVCFEWSTYRTRQWKKENRYSGKRGKVYTFCGYASC